jgi:hypothetical protein
MDSSIIVFNRISVMYDAIRREFDLSLSIAAFQFDLVHLFQGEWTVDQPIQPENSVAVRGIDSNSVVFAGPTVMGLSRSTMSRSNTNTHSMNV